MQGQGFWLQQTWDVLHVAKVLLKEVIISSAVEQMAHKLESNYTKEVLALLQRF